jgi:DNA-binding protein HU-beta
MSTKPASSTTNQPSQETTGAAQKRQSAAKAPRGKTTIQAAKKPAAKPPAKRKATAGASNASTTATVITQRSIFEEQGMKAGLTRGQAYAMMQGCNADIIRHVSAGSRLRMNNLGTIYAKPTPARLGHHPGTGETIQIPASKRVMFSPAKELQDSLT